MTIAVTFSAKATTFVSGMMSFISGMFKATLRKMLAKDLQDIRQVAENS
jgi:hypothetical protein